MRRMMISVSFCLALIVLTSGRASAEPLVSSAENFDWQILRDKRFGSRVDVRWFSGDSYDQDGHSILIDNVGSVVPVRHLPIMIFTRVNSSLGEFRASFAVRSLLSYIDPYDIMNFYVLLEVDRSWSSARFISVYLIEYLFRSSGEWRTANITGDPDATYCSGGPCVQGWDRIISGRESEIVISFAVVAWPFAPYWGKTSILVDDFRVGGKRLTAPEDASWRFANWAFRFESVVFPGSNPTPASG